MNSKNATKMRAVVFLAALIGFWGGQVLPKGENPLAVLLGAAIAAHAPPNTRLPFLEPVSGSVGFVVVLLIWAMMNRTAYKASFMEGICAGASGIGVGGLLYMGLMKLGVSCPSIPLGIFSAIVGGILAWLLRRRDR